MPKILVAEDDRGVRSMFRDMLEAAGYGVITACDGEEAESLYWQELPDLVITDLVMPGQHGHKAIAELRRYFPDVRAIAITGWGPDLLSRARDLGAARVFEKPVGRAELLKAVAELTQDS